MQTRAHLRLVGIADSPALLAGWSPARQVATTVTVGIRDLSQPHSHSLREGVAFGLQDVRRLAELSGVTLRTDWAAGLAGAEPLDGVQVVVADQDPPASDVLDTVTSIYTCALDEWRPEAWSVALAPASTWPPTEEWHPALHRHGAAALNDRFLRRTGRPMDAAAWRGWMAVQVAYALATRRAAGEDDLLAMRFDGHKGQPLHFGDDGHLVQPTYRVAGDGRLMVVAPRLFDIDN